MTVICLCRCVSASSGGQAVSCSFVRLEWPRGKERDRNRKRQKVWETERWLDKIVQLVVLYGTNKEELWLCWVKSMLFYVDTGALRPHVTVEHQHSEIMGFNTSHFSGNTVQAGTWLQGFPPFQPQEHQWCFLIKPGLQSAFQLIPKMSDGVEVIALFSSFTPNPEIFFYALGIFKLLPQSWMPKIFLHTK